MGLFSKKSCSICGGEIGLLGNRKLEDGNCCKDCAKKLSPFFSERRHSTVDSIKEQLAYREANQAVVEAFNPTLVLGNYTKVMIDEGKRQFIVTSASKWRDTNPDVLSFADVTGCDIKVNEYKTENRTTDKDGNSVSYNPPRFTYNYDFDEIIHVNNPYFDEIRVPIDDFSVEDGPFGSAPTQSAKYINASNTANEIKERIMNNRQDARDNAAKEAAPKTPVTCKCCGATTIPDAFGRCEYCGSSAI